MFVVDEVQTGYGRTGRMWADQHYDVEPDLMIVAKSIAGGLPLSGVIGKAEIMDAPDDSAIGGTYVGNPVAQAAALAVLDVFNEENLVERAGAIGQTIRSRMEAWQERWDAIGDVRGLGRDAGDRAGARPRDEGARRGPGATAVVEEAAQNGLLLIKSGVYGNCIRVLTPLVVTDAELDEALGVWEQALDKVLPPQSLLSAKLRSVIGELIAGRYELLRARGLGSMSSVFRAHDRLLERSVAIKVLHEQYSADEDYVERFRREARSVAQLAHPNIVTVIDRGEEDGRQYIVFEYVEGENLKGLLSHGALPVDQALRYGLQIAGALDFAHKRGLVHRDVKPQNVLLTEEGEPKVTDFGIARSVDVQSVTQSGTVLGTSDYIAPEQARGEQVDQRTDIYSLGVMLYELLTGEVPYSGDNFVAVAMQHLHDPVPSVLDQRRDVPVRLDLAVQRAMAKDPADRFESMEGLIDELDRCYGDLGPDDEATRIVRPPRRLARAKRPRRRPPVVPFLLILLAAAAVAGGAYLFFGDSPDVPIVAEESPSGPVRLTAAAAHDPFGDDAEHDSEIREATDGISATDWRTEGYQSFTKEGVGLVLSAPREVALSRLTVQAAPGFEARIQAGNNQNGPFENVSGDWQEVGATTTFDIDTKDKAYRYYVVWLRLPREGGQAQIYEVTART